MFHCILLLYDFKVRFHLQTDLFYFDYVTDKQWPSALKSKNFHSLACCIYEKKPRVKSLSAGADTSSTGKQIHYLLQT